MPIGPLVHKEQEPLHASEIYTVHNLWPSNFAPMFPRKTLPKGVQSKSWLKP